MPHTIPTVRTSFAHTALALGGSALWGAIEFVALCRSRWAFKGAQRRWAHRSGR